MLEELYIRNLALIEELRLEFSGGLNVLTGEPGSGKSLVVKALELLRGARADASHLRTGEEYLQVVGRFLLKNPGGDEELTLEREYFDDGRSRARINGRPATLANLKEIGTELVEIHGQHENQKILSPACQRAFLDAYAGISELVCELSDLISAYNSLKKDLSELEEKIKNERELHHLYEFQINELSEANLKIGEKDELQNEELILSHQAEIITLASEIILALTDKDDSVLAELFKISKLADNLASLLSEFAPLKNEIDESIIRLRESVEPLKRFIVNFDFSPERLEGVRRRLSRIYELEEKYNRDNDSLVRYLEELQERLQVSSGYEAELASLKERIREKAERINTLALLISESRNKASERLQEEFIRNALTLGFQGVSFEVSTRRRPEPGSPFFFKDSPHYLHPWGFEEIEFQVSLNPNENLYPLDKVASGGELSRISLILKEILSSVDSTPTLVFDEVDSGIGGRVAELIAEKLCSLKKNHQLIVITHLAQIAAPADTHIKLEKERVGERMVVFARRLENKDRISELARMIGGKKYAEQLAKELISRTKK